MSVFRAKTWRGGSRSALLSYPLIAETWVDWSPETESFSSRTALVAQIERKTF